MLVLTRRVGEEILIDKGQIQIKILYVRRGHIAVGIHAPSNVDVDRKEIYFKKLLKELPDNKYIKLRLAESLFQSDEIDDHMLALNTLSKIELSKGEWRVLLTYMPSAYVECFQTTKRNRT